MLQISAAIANLEYSVYEDKALMHWGCSPNSQNNSIFLSFFYLPLHSRYDDVSVLILSFDIHFSL